MNGIHEVNSSFAFDDLMLSPPSVIAGGNHFIKYSMKNTLLYIRTPKCATKGAISKTSKRSYCDLLFSNQDVGIIKWMEDLEAHTCKQIYENREKWFETDMELSDIENYFASPLKSYKSGKYHLVRTNIPTRLGKMNLKIYNENEEVVDPETITENTNIETILEVQGVKCSARSFQIEFEVKQMLTLSNVDIFDKCILLKKNESEQNAILTEDAPTLEDVRKDDEIEVQIESEVQTDFDLDGAVKEDDDVEDHPESTTHEMPDLHANTDATDLNLFSDLHEFEIDMNLESVSQSEPFQIKARNDVYYELYKEARKKARISRNMALQSYLDAKEIKTKYDLDDIESDEEDTFYNTILQSETTTQ